MSVVGTDDRGAGEGPDGASPVGDPEGRDDERRRIVGSLALVAMLAIASTMVAGRFFGARVDQRIEASDVRGDVDAIGAQLRERSPAPPIRPPQAPELRPAIPPAPSSSSLPRESELGAAQREAARFRATVLASCAREATSASGAPIEASAWVTFHAAGDVASLRIEGTADARFRRCVTLQAQLFSLREPIGELVARISADAPAPGERGRAEAARFRSTILLACARDTVEPSALPLDVTATLTFDARRGVAGVRITDTEHEGLRRCIVTRARSYTAIDPVDSLVVHATIPRP